MAKKQSAKSVEITQINLQDLIVPIKGITSLLTNRVSEIDLETIRRKDDGEPKLKDDRSEDQRFLDKTHLCDPSLSETEGRYGLPASAFRNAMVAVGRNKAASGGINMTASRQMFQVMGDIIPIRCREFRKRVDAAVNRSTKGLIRSVRPEFVDWEAELPIRYNADIISAAQIINLVQQAGFAPGVGGWRPECGGNHGMFEVKADMVAVQRQV